MLAFWPEILCPILTELRPNRIVEIGSESGKTTVHLLELVGSYGGTVCVIDPAPRFNAAEWQTRYGSSLAVFPKPSLEVLPELDRYEAVLIDGDHNWYTVYHELQAIERRASELGASMPIVFLHDTAWPYGRRDLYYDPTTVPEACRQPYERRGIHPASSRLVDRNGINSHLCNAAHEGGPRNGVLTAIEDYLATTSAALMFLQIPAAFGLGILVPEKLELERPDLAKRLRPWSDPAVQRFIERLELARIAASLPP